MNIRVKTIRSSKLKLFNMWLYFLKPYHKLTPKEIDVFAVILYYRHQLVTALIDDKTLIERLLFAPETRDSIREELGGMDNGVFNNMLFALRKKGVLSSDNIINESLIPPMSSSDNEFTLVFNFEINENNEGSGSRDKKDSGIE